MKSFKWLTGRRWCSCMFLQPSPMVTATWLQDWQKQNRDNIICLMGCCEDAQRPSVAGACPTEAGAPGAPAVCS